MKRKSMLEIVALGRLQKTRLGDPLQEYRFHPERKWRFDFAYIKQKIAIEIEGAVWSRGRHTRGTGFIADCEKYNDAAKRGWRVLRYTSNTIDNIIEDINFLAEDQK